MSLRHTFSTDYDHQEAYGVMEDTGEMMDAAAPPPKKKRKRAVFSEWWKQYPSFDTEFNLSRISGAGMTVEAIDETLGTLANEKERLEDVDREIEGTDSSGARLQCFKCESSLKNRESLRSHLVYSHYSDEIMLPYTYDMNLNRNKCPVCKTIFKGWPTKTKDRENNYRKLATHIGITHGKLYDFVTESDQPEIFQIKEVNRTKAANRSQLKELEQLMKKLGSIKQNVLLFGVPDVEEERKTAKMKLKLATRDKAPKEPKNNPMVQGVSAKFRQKKTADYDPDVEYRCFICGEVKHLKSTLKSHLVMKHFNDRVLEEAGMSTEMNLPCKFCGRLVIANAWKTNMSVHVGVGHKVLYKIVTREEQPQIYHDEII